jgi:hypothetical protein
LTEAELLELCRVLDNEVLDKLPAVEA